MLGPVYSLAAQVKLVFVFLFLFKVEGVGSISDGLSGAQWSPDQEILVLVTSKKLFLP
jgi:hypothetical protein